MSLDTIANYADWRDRARARLPRRLFDYIDGGSYAEVTLSRNSRDFETLTLKQRVMLDMSRLNLATELFGQTLSMPLLLDPLGFSGMYARRGEVQAARAAKAAGIPYCLSTLALAGVEEVAAGATPPWFQLYMVKDRGLMIDLLGRVKAAGSPVLLFTVDLQTPGARYRDRRSGMSHQHGWAGRLRQAFDALAHTRWFWDVYLKGRPHSFDSLRPAIPAAASFAQAWAWIGANFDPSVTWADLDFVRAHWDGPIVIKGVMTPEDAGAAVEAGASGLIVSNHGGRQLDATSSTIAALPAVVDAVAGRVPVLIDGGVRSGLDILKALAIGANACLFGRPYAFALAAAGEAGVARLLATTREELRAAMVLAGCADVRTAGCHLLVCAAHGVGTAAITRDFTMLRRRAKIMCRGVHRRAGGRSF